MRKTPMPNPGPRRGVALIITLSLLVLITVLVVGFTVNMRTEHQAAFSMSGAQRTNLVAQSALAHAVSLLQTNIPQPVPPGATPTPVNWVVNPGMLTIIQGQTGAGGGSGKVVVRKVPLSSNPPDTANTSYASTLADANLNPPLLNGGGNTILPTNQDMRVAWVPVLQNPALATSATNPIVGRYGFWIDDESAKVNVNTALGKPVIDPANADAQTPGVVTAQSANYPVGHPASINLDMLGPVDLPGLAQWVSGTSPLASVEGLKPFITTDPDGFVTRNKFNLTAWSRAPEFNVFGKSRLFLLRGQTGLPTHGFQFFRDLEAPMYFHACENTTVSSDGTAMYYTAKLLTRIFGRNDWPGMPARSFVDKWSGGAGGKALAQREADQIAWNIVARGNFADYRWYVTDASHASDPSGAPRTADDYFCMNNYIPAFLADGVTPSNQEGTSGSVNLPNQNLQAGPLSKKAIMPAFPFPLVDEICLQVLPIAVSVKVGGVATQMYYLKMQTQFEFWNPPGYPTYDCRSSGGSNNLSLGVGLTYLSVQASQGAVNVSQEDEKYISAATLDGIKAFYAGFNQLMGPGGWYLTTAGSGGATLNVRDKTSRGFSSSPVGVTNFDPANGPVKIDVKMRVFARVRNGPTAACQLIPTWDSHDPGTLSDGKWNSYPTNPTTGLGPNKVPALAPPPDDPKDYIEFKFDIDLNTLGDSIITRSLEVNDPRTGGLARMWLPSSPKFNQPTNEIADTLGVKNNVTTLTTADCQKFAYLDFSNAAPQSPRPPVGMFSTIPTGMQRGLPAATFKLQPTGGATELPDWLLLDLLAPTVDSVVANRTVAPSVFPLSQMNATAGKINLNAAIYPQTGLFTPPARFLPLQAVFQNMSIATTATGSPPAIPSDVVRHILNHDLAAGGQEYGAPGQYDYIGELCEIAGVADGPGSDWQKEYLVRNLANCLSTQSNVFSVWGVAQTVKKIPTNTSYGIVQAGDNIAGEKRFQAVVERYVWPGTDNSPGNGHAPAYGGYDQVSAPQNAAKALPGNPPDSKVGGTWETLDGPDAPTYPVAGNTVGTWQAGNVAKSYNLTSLEQALNPVRATMKYRVVAFRYLSD